MHGIVRGYDEEKMNIYFLKLYDKGRVIVVVKI